MGTFLTAVFAGKKVKPDFEVGSWEEKMDGKTAFIMFYAPWCGHCKKMKPEWHRAMRKIRKHYVEMGKVDCTSEGGKPLCEENGVKGYPKIMYGDPTALEEYSGERDKDSLLAFARALKPVCNPARMENCDEEQTARLKLSWRCQWENYKLLLTPKRQKLKKLKKLSRKSRPSCQ